MELGIAIAVALIGLIFVESGVEYVKQNKK